MDVLTASLPANDTRLRLVEPTAGAHQAPSPEVAGLVARFYEDRRAMHEGCEAKVAALAGLAALTALQAPASALRAHVRSALQDGASREEILTTVAEAALYSGFAAAYAGLEAALAVFAEVETRLARPS